MKKESIEEMDERTRTVLFAIVRYTISTGEAVGSRALNRELDLGLSAATIRGVMAELTEQGYLLQSHISAGRTPSEHAYRMYVKHLDISNPSSDVCRLIESTIGNGELGLNEILKEVTQILSSLTNTVGMVTTPKGFTRLRKLEFVLVDEKRIYVVLIADCNMVYQGLVRVSQPMNEEELRRLSAHLNRQFASQEMEEASEQVWKILTEEQDEYPELFAQVARISKRALNLPRQREIFVDGRQNLMRGFDNVKLLQELIMLLESKSFLIKQLETMLTEEQPRKVRVTIGSENPPHLSQCAMVAAAYGDGEEKLGELGVLGPANMDYQKIIPVIDYTANYLSNAVSTW